MPRPPPVTQATRLSNLTMRPSLPCAHAAWTASPEERLGEAATESLVEMLRQIESDQE